MNLIMCVPLRDQNGKVRYYLGAQLDITELVQNFTGLESLRKLLNQSLQNTGQLGNNALEIQADQSDEFQQLSETFTPQELERLLISRQQEPMGGKDIDSPAKSVDFQTHGIRPKNSSAKLDGSVQLQGFGSAPPLGFYQNVSS